MKIESKIIILGTGPAGYTAALYAARGGVSPLVLTGMQPGGQLTTTTMVDNWSGAVDGIDGFELMDNMRRHAEKFGAKVESDTIKSVDFSSDLLLYGEQAEYRASAVIIATGASHRHLGIPSEEKLKNKGVHYCATCDGMFYKNRDVAIIGGGNSAVEEATYLSRICKKVYLIVRSDKLKCEKIMAEKVKNTPNIEIVWESEIVELVGENSLSALKYLHKPSNTEKTIEVSGAFIAVGLIPNSSIFSDFVHRSESGHILLDTSSAYETSTHKAGVFVAGDVSDSIYRQAIVSAGTGCKAAIDAMKYIEKS